MIYGWFAHAAAAFEARGLQQKRMITLYRYNNLPRLWDINCHVVGTLKADLAQTSAIFAITILVICQFP
jgi:hypothetical protein